jgi:2-keto-4-pentenoate hydratase/2-oxohepta-3-ene-1,7-dioic acid hydratase in catechol pathway
MDASILTQEVDYEVELGVIIGSRARYVDKKDAFDYIFGYTVVNDVSARDLQFSDGQWVRAKSLDTFCPTGPCIVTRDEIPDPQDIQLRCSVNGVSLQDSSTASMIFGVAYLIADLSNAFTLEPGDPIATGTPAGVGMARKPKMFLQQGDLLVSEVEGIGRLENPIRHILKPITALHNQ